MFICKMFLLLTLELWVDVKVLERQLVSCCTKQEVRSKKNDKMQTSQTESLKQAICFHGA